MIYVLNIGYYSFAFSSMRGLQTVIETIGKAAQLEHAYFPGCEESSPDRLKLDPNPVKVSMNVVNGVSFVQGKNKREVIEPEVLPRQRSGESDAMFAHRAAHRAVKAGGRKAVAEFSRFLLSEGK